MFLEPARSQQSPVVAYVECEELEPAGAQRSARGSGERLCLSPHFQSLHMRRLFHRDVFVVSPHVKATGCFAESSSLHFIIEGSASLILSFDCTFT